VIGKHRQYFRLILLPLRTCLVPAQRNRTTSFWQSDLLKTALLITELRAHHPVEAIMSTIWDQTTSAQAIAETDGFWIRRVIRREGKTDSQVPSFLRSM
jgi:hypothetical protein